MAVDAAFRSFVQVLRQGRGVMEGIVLLVPALGAGLSPPGCDESDVIFPVEL